MSGDVQVRFCERLGVRFPRATHRSIIVGPELLGVTGSGVAIGHGRSGALLAYSEDTVVYAVPLDTDLTAGDPIEIVRDQIIFRDAIASSGDEYLLALTGTFANRTVAILRVSAQGSVIGELVPLAGSGSALRVVWTGQRYAVSYQDGSQQVVQQYGCPE